MTTLGGLLMEQMIGLRLKEGVRGGLPPGGRSLISHGLARVKGEWNGMGSSTVKPGIPYQHTHRAPYKCALFL